jgi:restriction system protein
VGADFDVFEDLTERLPENWKEFNSRYIPIVMKNNPAKTKIGAGLACGMLWTVSKGIQIGDVVISPTGSKNYYVGVVTSGYEYAPDGPLQHRRRVEWMSVNIEREQMSDALRHSTGSIGTVAEITKYAAELEGLISPKSGPEISVTDPTVEDPSVFALESHLEEFLIANWAQTPLGQTAIPHRYWATRHTRNQ